MALLSLSLRPPPTGDCLRFPTTRLFVLPFPVLELVPFLACFEPLKVSMLVLLEYFLVLVNLLLDVLSSHTLGIYFPSYVADILPVRY